MDFNSAPTPIPGIWCCRKCGLKVYKRALYMRSGTVGVDARLVREQCMNGCGLMVQATEVDMQWQCPRCQHESNSHSSNICTQCGVNLDDLTADDFRTFNKKR